MCAVVCVRVCCVSYAATRAMRTTTLPHYHTTALPRATRSHDVLNARSLTATRNANDRLSISCRLLHIHTLGFLFARQSSARPEKARAAATHNGVSSAFCENERTQLERKHGIAVSRATRRERERPFDDVLNSMRDPRRGAAGPLPEYVCHNKRRPCTGLCTGPGHGTPRTEPCGHTTQRKTTRDSAKSERGERAAVHMSPHCLAPLA